jgi:hypothetical protein
VDLSKVAEFSSPLLSALLGGSGLWAFMKAKADRNTTEDELLLLLVRDRIIEEGERYLERGYILSGEYADFYEELYKPYKELGGNGLAQHIFERIEKLPMLPDGSEGRNTS